jgi:hypothetical protein
MQKRASCRGWQEKFSKIPHKMNMENQSKSLYIKLIFLLTAVSLLLNISFVGIHYLGDLTSVKQAFFRINEGIDHQNVVKEDYPISRFGIQSTHVLVGLDQLTDCNIVYLMSMYRGKDRIKNAIVPGIAEPSPALKDSTRMCERVIGLATGKYPIDQKAIETKARLWHGAKAVFLLLAPHLDIFQMKILMEQMTYLLYMLIGILFTMYGYQKLLIFIPYGILGIMFSGIPFFDDLSNGLPYMVVLMCIMTILWIGRRTSSRKVYAIVLTIFGSLHAFFFVTDGAEMMAVSLLLIALYFACLLPFSRRERFLNVIVLITVYLIAFAASMMLKQVFSIYALGYHEVFKEFFDAITLRLSGQMVGGHVTASKTLDVIFGYFLDDFYYIKQIYSSLLYSSMVAWSLGLAAFVYLLIRGGEKEKCVDASIFILAGLVVIARYVIMRNHSYLHGAFVSRYLFIFLASGWALSINLLWHPGFEEKRLRSSFSDEKLSLRSTP